MSGDRKWVTAEQYDADRHDYVSASFGPCQHNGCGHGEHYDKHRPPVTPKALRHYNALADYSEFVEAGETGEVAARLAIEASIEVRLTPEMVNPVPQGSIYLDEAMRRTIACQVLEAAGFEVVE